MVELLQLHDVQLALLRDGLQRVAPPHRVRPHLEDTGGIHTTPCGLTLARSLGPPGLCDHCRKVAQGSGLTWPAFVVTHEREESEGTVDRMAVGHAGSGGDHRVLRQSFEYVPTERRL